MSASTHPIDHGVPPPSSSLLDRPEGLEQGRADVGAAGRRCSTLAPPEVAAPPPDVAGAGVRRVVVVVVAPAGGERRRRRQCGGTHESQPAEYVPPGEAVMAGLIMILYHGFPLVNDTDFDGKLDMS